MTQYKTKDGQEIKVGGVYRTEGTPNFVCFGFEGDRVIGRLTTGELDAIETRFLTSLPESQPEYDPEQMWVLYVEDEGVIHEWFRFLNKDDAKKFAGINMQRAFAIAPVGKKFKRGDGL